jgi:hypothetical protein
MQLREAVRRSALVLIVAYGLAWVFRVGGDVLDRAIGSTEADGLALSRVVGDEVVLPIDSHVNGDVLVLATSDRCPFSRESVPFHNALLAMAKKRGLSTVVIVKKGATAPKGLDDHSGAARAIQADLRKVRVTYTPTVMILQGRRVTGFWVGKLSALEEQAVLARVSGSRETLIRVGKREAKGSLRVLESAQMSLRQVAQQFPKSQVLDVRERRAPFPADLPNRVRIPMDELAARVDVELERNSEAPVVIDCSVMKVGDCTVVSDLLMAYGFPDVRLHNYASISVGCGATPVGR